ncbi:hypothetical protein [Streptomyces nigrescens]
MTDTPHLTDQQREALDRIRGHLDAALACLDEIRDPVERELAARVMTDDLLPAAEGRAKAVRTKVVQQLRTERGLKLREVADLIGLSIPRVDQLAKGK